jgi:phosphoribosylformylglycinamidine cyclo-ligase
MVLFETGGLGISDTHPLLEGLTIGEALLAVHRSYLSCLKPLLAKGLVRGLSHITGGGVAGNLSRILPEGCGAVMNPVPSVPGIFGLIAELGRIAEGEMRRTFNMGTGMLVVVESGDSARAIDMLEAAGETPFAAGVITAGTGQVEFE